MLNFLANGRLFLWAVLVFFMLCVPAHAVNLSLPLYKVSPLVKAVDLRCTTAEYSIEIPIPKRWDVKRGVLRFNYVNSSALLKQNSQLLVVLNDNPLTQLRLDPMATNGYAEVELPGALMTPGYNTLSFRVTQHYTLGCEAPCASELWTRLKLDEAMLDIEYQPEIAPLKLSVLPDLIFDPKIMPEVHLHLITDNLSEDSLTAAGIVASGSALRFEYRKTLFSLSDQVRGGMDNILLGEKKFVETFLDRHGVNMSVDGPVLKLVHLPVDNGENKPGLDPYHVLLVVSGRDPDEIRLAAETMSILSIPFPDGDEMKISEFALPEISQYEGKQMLKTDESYPFKKLDYKNHTFSGLNPASKELSFRLPPDFFIKPNQQATVTLDFSYGAGMRSDSVLNILLNGEFVSAVRLDNENGGLITGYRITLPTFLFKAGTNVLSFQTKMITTHAEHCEFLQTGNLQLTLFETSQLEFPQMPHRIELPRLDLLFLNGFPYTRWPDGYETLIVLSQVNPSSTHAALNLIGLLTQKNGYPLFGIRIGTNPKEKWDKELIVVGRANTIPREYYENAPLKLGEVNKVAYPVYQNWDIHTGMAWSRQSSEVSSEKGIIMQFASPFKEGRTATLITASSDEGVERLGQALLEPKVQGGITGDLVLVDYLEDKFKQLKFGDGRDFKTTAMKVGSSYNTGKGGEISFVDYYLSSYPWLYWLLLFLTILTVAGISFVILKRRKKRRLVPGDRA